MVYSTAQAMKDEGHAPSPPPNPKFLNLPTSVIMDLTNKTQQTKQQSRT